MKMFGFDWKGTRVVVNADSQLPIWCGSLENPITIHGKLRSVILHIGTKGLNRNNFKHFLATFMHELGHLDHFKETISKYGIIGFQTMLENKRISKNVQLRLEVEATVRATRFLDILGLLDIETMSDLVLSLATYMCESREELEKIVRALDYLAYGSKGS